MQIGAHRRGAVLAQLRSQTISPSAGPVLVDRSSAMEQPGKRVSMDQHQCRRELLLLLLSLSLSLSLAFSLSLVQNKITLVGH